MIIIDRLKFALLQGNMTQNELAEKAGLTQTTISNISRTGVCKRSSFLKLLNAFEVEAEELISEDFQK